MAEEVKVRTKRTAITNANFIRVRAAVPHREAVSGFRACQRF
jgi:hypothetical protein